jgi:NAD(P)-dependent dehydrogenase (short-subunit alcohol dehydrogenase family)
MGVRPLAIITGGGRGIGAAAAFAFAREGYDIVLCSRTQKELEETQARIKQAYPECNTLCVVMDLADHESILSCFKEIEIVFKRSAQVLVNNGAIAYPVDILHCSPEEWDRFQAINVRGAFLCAQKFAQSKILDNPKGRAAIVNVSSLGGLQGLEKFPGLTPYSVSKFGLTGLTELLAVEFKPYHIRVVGVAPGAVDTEMLKKAAPHLRTRTQPESVARVITQLCDEHGSHLINGTTIPLYTNE